ncbi:MAG: FtsW/RodA/SpoVE family cell cycle protein [Niabella sp.]|nr:FtsW/RodA/SpoVE family cell cycle protein [Niabella sp.]
MAATAEIETGEERIKTSRWKGGLDQHARGDKVIWALVVLLTLVSLLTVYSATGSLAYKKYKGNTEVYLFKQVIFILLGFAVVYFAHRVNYTIYSKVARILFILSIPLLAYTLFFGVKMNEGSRWIRVPLINMTMQTSDLAKLALFMYLARLLSRKQQVIKNFKKGFLPVILPIGITCLLIAPANLSTALLLGASCMMLLFIGRVSVKHLLLVAGVALIPLIMLVMAAMVRHKSGKDIDTTETTIAVKKATGGLTTRVDTWIGRVENFIYGGKEADNDEMYQVNQAKIAIAKGGFVGVGPGNSTTRDYLPQAYNDFIFAIIIEEYGLIGGAFILFIYIVFLYRCIRIFKRCPFAFGAFLALGLSFTLAIQAVANMAVTVNLFPVTGVTLPLVSMGGSSFLFTCLAIGIILSVSRNVESMEQPQVITEAAEEPAEVVEVAIAEKTDE